MPDTFLVCSCALSADFHLDETENEIQDLGGQGLGFAVWRAGTGQ